MFHHSHAIWISHNILTPYHTLLKYLFLIIIILKFDLISPSPSPRFSEMRRLVGSRALRLVRSLSPVANPFHFSFALNASATATRCGLWQPVVYGSVCSYWICDKILHVRWITGNYFISRMTVNKISVWIWRWRVWKVKKVRKTTATYQTARRTGSTTKVNRYRYDFLIYFFHWDFSHPVTSELRCILRRTCSSYWNFFGASISRELGNNTG